MSTVLGGSPSGSRVQYFLAHFQHSKWGRCDEDEYNLVHALSYHEIYDVDDYKWELTIVFTSDGKQLAENMAVNEDAVQAGLFDEAEPDDEEYEGWIRNEGANTTHFYHRSYLMLMPRACRFEFLKEAANERKANITTWIDMLIQEMGEEPTRSTSKEEPEKLCSHIIATNTPRRNSQKNQGVLPDDNDRIGVRRQPQESKAASQHQEEVKGIFQNEKGTARVADKYLGSVVMAVLKLNRPSILEDATRLASRMLPTDALNELCRNIAGGYISRRQK